MEIYGAMWLLVGMIIVAIPTIIIYIKLSADLRRQKSRNRGLSSKYGKITEQFLPLLNTYPWDPGNFRFLGSPIDGVQFESDQVILVEFKAGDGKLSEKQRRIRDLVSAGKVSFEIIKVG